MKRIAIAGILLGLAALVTGQSAATGVTGNLFVPVPPCRMFDTRQGSGAPLAQGTYRLITITGACGIPGDGSVKAVSTYIHLANINEAGFQTNGVLTVGQPPTGAEAGLAITCSNGAPCISWLNYPYFQSQIGNSGITVVNAQGEIIIGLFQAGGSADVIIDVNGYYVPGVPAASFAAGAGSCGTAGSVTSWSKCSTTIQDGRIKAGSFVFAQYKTRLADDQIPTRVYNIVDGAFSVELQGGTSFLWFAYLP